MRVISISRLRRFWETLGYEDAEGPLRAWYTHVKSRTVTWHTWAEVKAEFATVSIVGSCFVFNIGRAMGTASSPGSCTPVRKSSF